MEIEKNFKSAKKEIEFAIDITQLDQLKIKYTGRKSIISQITKSLSQLKPEQRKTTGQLVNKIKIQLQELFELKEKSLIKQTKEPIKKTNKDFFDLTLPPIPISFVHPHPINQIMNEIVEIFVSLGYSIVLGPEIETDYYNFTALNIPRFHPARDMQDTFYIKDNFLLRTHTSGVQIHTMEKYKPPIRIVVPGKVYRHDAVDATHLFMFHQVEGLAVDTDISFSDLKGTLSLFVKHMFGTDTKVKFLPSYFPFTEPSAEMYIECIICKGKGCKVCKQTGWLEMLGCGMVHPKVFDNVGYERNKFRGFAFGLGVERFAMLKYNIDDVRIFYENDIRFLKQL